MLKLKSHRTAVPFKMALPNCSEKNFVSKNLYKNLYCCLWVSEESFHKKCKTSAMLHGKHFVQCEKSATLIEAAQLDLGQGLAGLSRALEMVRHGISVGCICAMFEWRAPPPPQL